MFYQRERTHVERARNAATAVGIFVLGIHSHAAAGGELAVTQLILDGHAEVICYLMKYYKMDFDTSLALAKECRSQAGSKRGFLSAAQRTLGEVVEYQWLRAGAF